MFKAQVISYAKFKTWIAILGIVFLYSASTILLGGNGIAVIKTLPPNNITWHKYMKKMCQNKYLKLPKRRVMLEDSNDMREREIIYEKRNIQIYATCEKYKDINIFQDTQTFKTYGDPFLFDVNNNLAWCRIAKVSQSKPKY